MKRTLIGILVAFGLALGGGAAGQAPTVDTTAAAADAPKPRAARTAGEKAALIQRLIEGELAPDVDPRPLFTISVGRDGPDQLITLLGLVDDPAALRSARESPGKIGRLSGDLAALTLARAEFLTLPASRREALLNRSAAQAAAAPQSREARLAALNQDRQALQDFLAAKPAAVDALELNLLDPNGPALSEARRRAILEIAHAAAAKNKAELEAASARKIAEAQAETDALLGKVLALPPADFRRLAVKSGLAPPLEADAEAAAAARARAKAELEAMSAESELKRLVATERANLLAAKERQARFEAALLARKGATVQVAETTLEWRRKVRELEARPRFESGRQADADALYSDVVSVLRGIRTDLRRVLQARNAAPPNLRPAPIDETLTTGPTRAEDLVALRAQVLKEADRLAAVADQQRSDERAALYAAMVSLNEARLSLVDEVSPGLRSRVLGFGAEGLAQVQREIDQIVLSLTYNLQELPRSLGASLQPFLHPTPSVVFGLSQLVLVLLVFRWWRRNGERVVRRAEASYRVRRQQTLVSTAAMSVLGYIRRLGRPLDWFLLVLIAWLLQPAWFELIGLEFFWIIAIWLASTAFLIRAVDVLAHSERGADPRAELRRRSLRLIAGLVLVIGLALTLTSASVGEGAIYSWVVKACWLPLAPAAFILADWWKERIGMLAEVGARRGPILSWAARRPQGALGAVARVAAGGVLLLEGLRSNLANRARNIALIREIFDQRAQRRAAERAASDQASGRFRPLSDDRAALLDPHRAAANPAPVIAGVPALATPRIAPGAVQALVGERGLGKSTALSWWREAIGPGDVIALEAGEGGFQALLDSLATALGVPRDGGDPEAKVLAVLAEAQTPKMVFVDDLQRLVVPAIGGLADFDRLIEFTRRAGAGAAWIFACGAAAWSYVSRARHDRIPFDSVVYAPRWSDESLRALVERRTAQAGLEPVFEQLEHLGRMQFDSDIGPDERSRRSYFDALCEYCQGNPAVTLEFWRRSLFEDVATGRTVVRTFATPDSAVLGALPPHALYVLRTILQMDVANAEVIQRCTDLPDIVVRDAVRALIRVGVVAPQGSGFRTSLYWLREATRILERRNLLLRSRP